MPLLLSDPPVVVAVVGQQKSSLHFPLPAPPWHLHRGNDLGVSHDLTR